MEMPIRVMIVLFVVVIVGGIIILFSKNILDQAGQDLNDWRINPEKQDLIVEVDVATTTTLVGLANECIKRYEGDALERHDCFAVFADTFNLDGANGMELDHNFTLDTSAVSGSPSAVKLTFDPFGTVIVS